jgi:hypothetical protein
MNDQELKLYTLHTNAPLDDVRRYAVGLALRTGHRAQLSETPDGAIVVIPHRVWGAARWWAVVAVLSGAPFALRYVMPEAIALQGFGLGWMSAAIVLLTGRKTFELEPPRRRLPRNAS